ncbi:hypothetical protein SDC49_25120 [Lactobacillus sp. R2/2]|nr:hypothetical protein [Lactobacillus sp. R2/2]
MKKTTIGTIVAVVIIAIGGGVFMPPKNLTVIKLMLPITVQ